MDDKYIRLGSTIGRQIEGNQIATHCDSRFEDLSVPLSSPLATTRLVF